ncbi:MAG: DUF126 domain-containing protein [Thermoplasmata archaeon]
MLIRGRGISEGKARGKAVVLDSRVSFLGDVDPDTGSVNGRDIRDSILIFHSGIGSTVGSYVIYQLKRNGNAPKAMINESTETIVAAGSIISDIPLVDGIPIDIFKDGDVVEVNGTTGEVDLKGVKKQPVVTSFLMKDGKVLLVKRGDEVGSYKGRWSAISGYMEDTPREQAEKEIEEETGMEVDYISSGEPVYVRYKDKVWEVHPFIFKAKGAVKLNWENIEYRWVKPEMIREMDTVPKLWEAYRSARS